MAREGEGTEEMSSPVQMQGEAAAAAPWADKLQDIQPGESGVSDGGTESTGM